MPNLELIALAIAPGLAIGIYIFWKDKWEKEPLHWLLFAFLLGMVSVVPTVLLSVLAQLMGSEPQSEQIWVSLLSCIFGIGLIEEFCKFIFVRWFIYPKRVFNEPFDGITYCVMSAMGFATLENIMYVTEHGVATGIMRAFLSVPAHATWGILLGFALGIKKMSPELPILIPTLLFAAILHGLFDFFLFQSWGALTLLGALATFAFSLYLSKKAIRLHQHDSPFKN
jgi:RsiW-degrading membrane proteinase PrsW (M82 family)